jgi:ribosomal protein S18 acetylase RimI-like enzyme
MEAMSASTVPAPLHGFDPTRSDGSHDQSTDGASLSESVPISHQTTVNAPEEPLLTIEVPPRHIVIRYLREADNRALEWQGGADLRDWYQAQWQGHCAGHVCALVADFNNHPIGQAAIHWRGKPTHPHIPDIQSLRVFPAFHGMGIGSRLLEACECVVRERGFNEVSLAVGIENVRARALYERVGYTSIGEVYTDEWHFVDARGEVQHMSEVVIDLVKTL